MTDGATEHPQSHAIQAMLGRYFHQRRRSGFVDELIFAAKGLSPDDEVTTDDATGALRLVPDVRRDLDRAEVTLIESLMDRGWTWEQLGNAYGERSKQAMQQHYRRRGGKRAWPMGERQTQAPTSPEDSPHRLTAAELNPADVETVRAAIAALLSTTHDVASEYTADGVWAGFDQNEDLVEQIATIGLEALPRLEVGCRTTAKAITDMVQAGWNRRDPGREARRRESWSERLDDSLKETASWLDKLPHDVPLPRVDRPLVLGERTRRHGDSIEIDRADAGRLRATIDLALSQLQQHQATVDSTIDELRRRRTELG